MVTVRETTPTGLMVTVIKVHEVRVGDRLYLRHTVPGDVRTVTAVHKSKSDTTIEFDRGSALAGEALRRCRGVLWRVDPDAEVGDLPDPFDLLPPLEQWIELGGAIRVEHTSRQYEWSAQMLTAMHKDANLDVYRCYAVNPRSLLVDRLPDGRFDEDDPRPQVLLRPHLPLAVWTRDGADAALTLLSPEGVPLTTSGLVSGRGDQGPSLLRTIARIEPNGPVEDGATHLTDVPLRPLIATRPLPSAVTDTLLLETCAELETLFAAAFFGLLGVSAPESERWDR